MSSKSQLEENKAIAKLEDDARNAVALNQQELASFDATPEGVKAFIESLGLSASDLEYQGDPYPLAEKAELVDVPLFFVQWDFGFSTNFSHEYVNVKAIRLDTGAKVSIFDTGVGIFEALNQVTDHRIEQGLSAVRQGLQVAGGLRRSDYPATDTRPAGTTYYLN